MRRGLVVVALLAAGLAPVLDRGLTPGGPDLRTLEAGLAPGGAAWIDPVSLGEAIRDRTGVTVFDLRDSGERDRPVIPGARRLSVDDLGRGAVLGPSPVFVDGGDGAAVRAWLLARRLGHSGVRVLEGGVPGWVTGVLDPVLPVDTPGERARFERVAAVSRYFGGMPRIGDPAQTDSTDPAGAIDRIRRRGCL